MLNIGQFRADFNQHWLNLTKFGQFRPARADLGKRTGAFDQIWPEFDQSCPSSITSGAILTKFGPVSTKFGPISARFVRNRPNFARIYAPRAEVDPIWSNFGQTSANSGEICGRMRLGPKCTHEVGFASTSGDVRLSDRVWVILQSGRPIWVDLETGPRLWSASGSVARNWAPKAHIVAKWGLPARSSAKIALARHGAEFGETRDRTPGPPHHRRSESCEL